MSLGCACACWALHVARDLQAMSAEDGARRLLDGMPAGDIDCAYLYFCIEERARIHDNHRSYQAVWGPMGAAEVTRELQSRWESLEIDDPEQYKTHCSAALDDRKPLSRLLATVSIARDVVADAEAVRASKAEHAAQLVSEALSKVGGLLAARRFIRMGHFAAMRASKRMLMEEEQGTDSTSAGDDSSESEASSDKSDNHGDGSTDD